ncbi:hypothetical protein QYE76_046692 [Lolium multiflorum]|uniref:U-box domain-containing protein n=1 Tax=Lolium multiflorum TaxID=4521 RepID=A0AAD8TQC8_LOLMU|nr:hypothetical protein QYE76_046692 [Lolium multiflorum]
MRDPVVVSTGQTYDRPSIIQWIWEGHCTCPNSGQVLADNRLVPNRALRSLISQWCGVYCFQYDSPESNEGMAECVATACSRQQQGGRRGEQGHRQDSGQDAGGGFG